KIITLNGRKLLENPLSESPDDGYQMDFCQLERLFRHERPPLMILCNPHNPTGRCWSANELEQLLLLCEAYDVTLISDEIWADLLLPGETFTSVLHLGERWHKRVISATAASKTFGLSSLRISNFLIPDPTLRQRFLSRLDAHGLDVFNALSVQAATTAWNESRQWLDSLL
ncbi:aminotransferase class I/II-fold pyridoxal phosphate-dependent enzyme, partial [Salmonella enterica]|nr:aminotransferase class I/II-fold pyridoxal phosphate-dependent enzyme [Salmonella enterica]